MYNNYHIKFEIHIVQIHSRHFSTKTTQKHQTKICIKINLILSRLEKFLKDISHMSDTL